MSTAGSAGSAASRGEAARARTERAKELRRNSRDSRSTRAPEPEPQDGDTLPAELTQSTMRAEQASQGARRHAASLTDTVAMLRDAQLLPAERICEMITEEADTVTTLISSHVDQALDSIINKSVMPIVGQLMEKIATNAAEGEDMDLTQITENLREELEQRLKVGAEGKVKLSMAMADWYTTKIQRMANLDAHPVVAREWTFHAAWRKVDPPIELVYMQLRSIVDRREHELASHAKWLILGEKTQSWAKKRNPGPKNRVFGTFPERFYREGGWNSEKFSRAGK